jgi:acyl dehydratase
MSDDDWTGPVRTFAMPIERGTVEAFARAIGQADATTVPPTFAVVADRFDPDFPRRPPLGEGWAAGPPETNLHVEQWFEHHTPLVVGEQVEVRRGPGRRWERQGRSGRLEFLEERTELRASDGSLRVVTGWVDVRTEAAHRDLSTGARPDASVPGVVPARPDEVCVVDAITVTQFVMYVGAAGDFHPLHHDLDLARSLGYPDVFAPGMSTMALTLRGAAELGVAPTVGRVSSRFRAQVWPGDSLFVSISETSSRTAVLRTRNQVDETVLESTVSRRDG